MPGIAGAAVSLVALEHQRAETRAKETRVADKEEEEKDMAQEIWMSTAATVSRRNENQKERKEQEPVDSRHGIGIVCGS